MRIVAGTLLLLAVTTESGCLRESPVDTAHDAALTDTALTDAAPVDVTSDWYPPLDQHPPLDLTLDDKAVADAGECGKYLMRCGIDGGVTCCPGEFCTGNTGLTSCTRACDSFTSCPVADPKTQAAFCLVIYSPKGGPWSSCVYTCHRKGKSYACPATTDCRLLKVNNVTEWVCVPPWYP
jgi:hypothetical protein